MTGERDLPAERGVVAARPDAGGGAATPASADRGGHLAGERPAAIEVGGRRFTWGSRTYIMGILNVTPDSFSGDGLLAGDPAGYLDAALAQARSMVDEGADLLDVGGESTRPGHALVDAAEERRRIVPVIEAIHLALPDVPISVDTTKPSVAAAALDVGAALINDVWGVAEDDGLARIAAERGAALVVMHNRAEARYRNVVAEVLADLWHGLERAMAAGVPWDRLIVDPGFGFGKAPSHNLQVLGALGALAILGRPVMLGASRKSTLGKVLDLPADERLEATLATTVLAAQAGVDIVRVHDVRANVRAARMTDAVVRTAGPVGPEDPGSDESIAR
jgi:dihydropteroate synthase